VPLQDELRELFTQVGPQVFGDADTFRGAFDDFVPEGAATTGERRLLVDAIATGSFQRLLAQLEIHADPEIAIAVEAARLARDRGTVETHGARWALSALAYAHGLAGVGRVSTRPFALGDPGAETEPEPAPTPAPPLNPDAFESTFTRPGADVPAPPAASSSTPAPADHLTLTRSPADPAAAPAGDGGPGGRGRVVAIIAVLVALAVAAVIAVVLLGDGDEPGTDREATGGDTAGTEASADGSTLPAAPAGLPALPSGFPETFELTVRLPAELVPSISARFGPDVGTEVFAGGDPQSPRAQAESGPQPTGARVRDLVAAGIPARVQYYALPLTGQDGGELSGGDLIDLVRDRDEMATYWTNVRDLLRELGSVEAPVELLIEQDVAGELLSGSPDATTIPFAVADTGVEGLDGLPDTFAGWAQAWLTLRDELAPQVRVGLTVSPWQINDDFIPDLPTEEQASQWATAFGESYATLGARFDFLDNIMVYAEGGSRGERYIPDERFFERLLTWVSGISAATDTRVILDNVPVGNSVYRTLDDTAFHWRDSWVEWILAGDDFPHLVALRDAGVIGIVFGVDGGRETTTCPCDAAGDGVTNAGSQGKPSTSADDDGGYLAERLMAYAATGGLPL